MMSVATKHRKRAGTPKRISESADIFGSGGGETIVVEGTYKCVGCGGRERLRFRGAADSLGVRLTCRALENGALCSDCDDRETANERAVELAERREHHRELRIAKSGVPKRWQAVTFERIERDVDRVPAIEAAEAWAQADSPRGLLLWGDAGIGKTVLSAAAAMVRLQSHRLRWLSVARLLTDLRMPFDTPEYKAALRRLDVSEGTALVLDDLDKVRPTEHNLQPLYVAINDWVERPLPLLVSMNRSPREFAVWADVTFGESLASRLVGYSQVVEVLGRDRRMD